MKRCFIKRNNAFIINIIILLLFIATLLEKNIIGIERISATYVVFLFILLHLTKNWKKSLLLSIIPTLTTGLIDNRGLFSDYKHAYKQLFFNTNKYKEKFELKPAGDGAEGDINSYASSKTNDMDDTNITEKDLDKILEKDEKQGKDENEHLKKAGGGLDQLKNLLELSKKESPYDNKKDMNDYSPAQAQRATYHLIDTVKQLKETMNEMMPLMSVGKNLISLHKQMGGDNLTK